MFGMMRQKNQIAGNGADGIISSSLAFFRRLKTALADVCSLSRSLAPPACIDQQMNGPHASHSVGRSANWLVCSLLGWSLHWSRLISSASSSPQQFRYILIHTWIKWGCQLYTPWLRVPLNLCLKLWGFIYWCHTNAKWYSVSAVSLVMSWLVMVNWKMLSSLEKPETERWTFVKVQSKIMYFTLIFKMTSLPIILQH
jgi:hypothetical protein